MRRSLEARLHDLIETHPHAANLSAEAAYAWLRLGRVTDRLGELDTLRLQPGLRTLEELARAFCLSVTQTARGLGELIRRGCLLVVENAFKLPAWTGVASRKAISARENGRKRQGSTSHPPAPAQRRLPLLARISGARASVTDATTTTSKNLPERKVVVAPESASATEAEAIAQELGQLAGLTEAQVCRSVGQVDCWLRRGIPAEAMREGVRRVLRRPNLPLITGLGYFDGAITDASKAKPCAPVAAEAVEVNPLEQRARKAWQPQILAWQANGCVGPMPRLQHFIDREQLAKAA